MGTPCKYNLWNILIMDMKQQHLHQLLQPLSLHTQWWKLFTTSTKLGKEITKSVLQEHAQQGGSGNSSPRRKRSGSANSVIKNTTLRALSIGVGGSNNNGMTNSVPSSENIFKQQVFNYVKFQKPKKRRDMNKRGRNVVSEIHPSQMDEAALFMARSLMFGFSLNGNHLNEDLFTPQDHNDENAHNSPHHHRIVGELSLQTNAVAAVSSSSPISIDSPLSSSNGGSGGDDSGSASSSHQHSQTMMSSTTINNNNTSNIILMNPIDTSN